MRLNRDVSMGVRIRWARRMRKLNQGDCAAFVGVTQVTWSKWEFGARISRNRVPKIAEALGVSGAWLLEGDSHSLSVLDTLTPMERPGEPAARHSSEQLAVERARAIEQGAPTREDAAQAELDEHRAMLRHDLVAALDAHAARAALEARRRGNRTGMRYACRLCGAHEHLYAGFCEACFPLDGPEREWEAAE